MDEFSNPSPPSPGEFSPGAQPSPAHQQPKSSVIFFGPYGLRSGWRALIYLALSFLTLLLFSIVYRVIFPMPVKSAPGVLSPRIVITGEVLSLMALLLTMFLIATREHRAVDSYGLPGRGAFGSTFWMGAVFGFLALTALLLALRGFHAFYFGTIALRGGLLLRYAALWGIAFVLVGVWEEYFFRGYLQFVLTRGIGFWPGAALTALLFGVTHRSNSGESWIGLIAVVAVGLFFCLTLRRTGDLWFAVGFHAAWDYAQSFVYGVPDSGQPAVGHLFNSRFQGPAWLTGGSVGPEGSVLVFADLALAALAVTWLYPKAKYPEATPAISTSVAVQNQG